MSPNKREATHKPHKVEQPRLALNFVSYGVYELGKAQQPGAKVLRPSISPNAADLSLWRLESLCLCGDFSTAHVRPALYFCYFMCHPLSGPEITRQVSVWGGGSVVQPSCRCCCLLPPLFTPWPRPLGCVCFWKNWKGNQSTGTRKRIFHFSPFVCSTFCCQISGRFWPTYD